MKNRHEIDAGTMIVELVRANTDALAAVVAHLADVIAVARAFEAARPEPAVTRKVAVSKELLEELKGRPPGVRTG